MTRRPAAGCSPGTYGATARKESRSRVRGRWGSLTAGILEERECGREPFAPAGLEHVAVRHDDAVEVPAEHPVHRAARGTAITDHRADETVRAEAAGCAGDPVEEPRASRTPRGDVEGEIGQHQGAAGRVDEHDLVQHRSPAEEVLVDPIAPLRRRLVPEHGVDPELPPRLP